MKKEVAEYVAHCLTCQQTKAEHQRPAGLLQWVIVDRLTKSSHFLPIKIPYSADKLADLYIAEIVRLHGVPKSIISDRDGRFTLTFWKRMQEGLGTQLKFGTAFHPQKDDQSERTIQTLEDMLRACVLDFQGSWSGKIPLMEFAYNNSYHDSIKMAPYEALYEQKCRSPIQWHEAGERKFLGTEEVDKVTKVMKKIQGKLQTPID